MKKEYLSPEMEVVNIQTMSVLATSEPLHNEDPDGDVLAPTLFGGGGGSDEEW